MTVSRLQLISREDCPLCEEMHSELAPWVSEQQAVLTQLDVDADPVLKRRYGYRVPVLLIDGEPACYTRLDWDEIRRLWAMPSHS